MTRSAFLFTGLLSLTASLIASGCGSSSRQLQGITITPPVADAKDFPNGKVQFTASGNFAKPITWCVAGPTSAANPAAYICEGNIEPFATIDQNGLTQCAPLSQGTVFILGGDAVPPANPDQGPVFKLYGSAQLTCP